MLKYIKRKCWNTAVGTTNKNLQEIEFYWNEENLSGNTTNKDDKQKISV